MSRNLPVKSTLAGASQPSSITAALVVRRAEIDTFTHDVRAAAVLRNEQTDAIVTAEATRINMREELLTLAEGRALAGDDPEAHKLVTRKVRGLGYRNDWRLDRKFGW
jgi:hypothetical protein